MRLSLPVVFLLAACGSEESATPDPTTSSVDASASSSSVSGSSSQSSSAASSGAGGSTPAGPDVESGSRIRALRLVADDGAKGPAGWFDSSLEVECTFGLASDGATRCMPRGPVWDGNTYGDQECTRPLLEVSVAAATGCSPPTYVLDDQSAAAACTGARRIAVRPTIGTYDQLASVHRRTGSGCTQVDVDEDALRYVELDEALPASDFVAATIAAE